MLLHLYGQSYGGIVLDLLESVDEALETDIATERIVTAVCAVFFGLQTGQMHSICGGTRACIAHHTALGSSTSLQFTRPFVSKAVSTPPPLLRMPISLKELTSDWNQKQPFECLKQEKRTRLRVNRSGTSNVMGKHVLDLCLSSAPLKTVTITERRAGKKSTNDRPGRRNVFEPKIGRQRK